MASEQRGVSRGGVGSDGHLSRSHVCFQASQAGQRR